MASLKLTKNGGAAATFISNVFIENFMPKANPMFATIYIFTYKRLNGGAPVDTAELAAIFNILESDVLNAWRYWESVGLVTMTKQDSNSFGLTFIEPPEINGPPSSAAPEEKSPRKPKKKPKFDPDSKTDYSPQELEYYQTQSEEIRNLFAFAEQELGRTLKYTDLNTLYGLHDWLRLPIPVIEALIVYCCGSDHRSMGYIETVAIDWRESGIDSAEAAEEKIRLFNKDYRSVLKAFGQQSRGPAPKEIEFMDRWLKELGLPLETVLEACDRTIIALGKPNFKYADSILDGWAKNGIRTLEDVKNIDTGAVQIKSEKTRRAPKNKGRFVNFEGRPIDYDEMEKREREFIKDIVGNATVLTGAAGAAGATNATEKNYATDAAESNNASAASNAAGSGA